MNTADEIGTEIAEDISSAIEAAQNETAQAENTADQIAAAAMENERGHHIERLERDLYECRETISEIAQGLASVTLGLTEQGAKMDLLIQQASPPPPPPQAVESEVPTLPEIVIAEAPEPEAPASQPPPSRKRFRDRLI